MAEKDLLEPVSSKAPTWFNTVLTWILRSPLHSMRSKTDMLLTFRGRKSGKVYTVPVCYVRTDQTVICITKVPWWKNLRNGAPVTVRVQGQDLQGVAETIVDDKAAIAESIDVLLRAAPVGAKYYAIRMHANGEPDPQDVAKATQFTVLIRIHLTIP